MDPVWAGSGPRPALPSQGSLVHHKPDPYLCRKEGRDPGPEGVGLESFLSLSVRLLPGPPRGTGPEMEGLFVGPDHYLARDESLLSLNPPSPTPTVLPTPSPQSQFPPTRPVTGLRPMSRYPWVPLSPTFPTPIGGVPGVTRRQGWAGRPQDFL